jgi:cytochrome c556
LCFRLKAVMIAVLLVFACVSCTNRQNEEHTVDATYEASKEEMRKVYEE